LTRRARVVGAHRWGQAPPGKPFDGVALPMNESSWYLEDTFGARLLFARPAPSPSEVDVLTGISRWFVRSGRKIEARNGPGLRTASEQHKNHFESFKGERD
jgi:hypothetical protein